MSREGVPSVSARRRGVYRNPEEGQQPFLASPPDSAAGEKRLTEHLSSNDRTELLAPRTPGTRRRSSPPAPPHSRPPTISPTRRQQDWGTRGGRVGEDEEEFIEGCGEVGSGERGGALE